MGTRVAVAGTGAVGGFIGGHMTRAGEDVTLIDMWPEHVEHLRKHGMRVSGMTPEESHTIPVKAIHISDVQALSKQPPIDVAFVCCKSYDTPWVARLIAPYLAHDGFLVSAQNCINEETIASVVGWGKTLGVVISQIGVEMYQPGNIRRTSPRGGKHIVFRAGEVHGRVTPRAEEVARLVSAVDTARVTTNLWGERWSKLVLNAMGNALPSIAGVGNNDRDRNDALRLISIKLASEAIRVGQALGYELEEMFHMSPEMLARAGEGDAKALDEISGILLESTKTRHDDQRPSMAQDITKGRRTETDEINGFVAAKGEMAGVPTPMNAKIHALVKSVERGELKPGLDVVKGL